VLILFRFMYTYMMYLLDVYYILYFPHLLGGFLHICVLYIYYICGLWPPDNVSCLFLTWYQSPGSRFRVLVFAIYCKIVVAPLCVHVLAFSSPVCVHVLIFSSPVCVHVLTFSSSVTHEWGC
jgi:hypothetical protein